MKKKVIWTAAFLLLVSCNNGSMSVFDRVERICNRDGGKLWGVNLYSPVLGVDSLRHIVSNVADAPETFPPDMPVANSTTELDGRRWTMVIWPLSGDERHQNELLIHEMFHFRQPELGFELRSPNNSHLSNRDARTLLKLEWNALKAAAGCRGERKTEALTDALAFRAMRRQLYPDYAAEECSLEILEGLAEYTGRRLASPSDKEYIRGLSSLDYLYSSDNLTRSFAYLSGPLYGLVLDQSGRDWRKEMKVDSDLGAAVKEIYGVELPDNLEEACEAARMKYGFEAVDAVEEEFERQLEERNAELARLFAPENVISLDCPSLAIQFPPNGMIQMDDGSMIIYGGEAYCDWGYVEGRPLKVTADWRHVELPRLDTLSVRGDTTYTSGWTMVRKK